MQFIKNFDCFNFQETWLKNNLNFSEHFCIQQNGIRKTTRGRFPGGVLSLLKNDFLPSFECLKCSIKGVVAYKIKCESFDCCVINVYRQPNASRYVNQNLYNEIGEFIIEKSAQYPGLQFVLGGDFNARIGNLKCNLSEIGEDFQGQQEIMSRANIDNNIDASGKKLITFCEDYGLQILNGCVGSDKRGNLTYFGCNGTSTIDYVLCSQLLIPYINDFYIDIRAESHHMPLVLEFKNILPQPQPTENMSDTTSCITLRKFKWSIEKCNEFLSSIISYDFTNFMAFMNTLCVTDILDYIQFCITTAAQKLEVRCYYTKAKTQTDNYHDADCDIAKKKLTRALKHCRNKHTKENIRLCNTVRKEYGTLKERKFLEWKQNKISEVRNVIQDKDKSKLYALLKKFQRKELASNSILPSQWNDHFKNVLCGHERINTRVILHNYRYIIELDAPFTMDELNFALRELKNNKAPGVDGVPAEIYKHAYNNPHIADIWLDILNKLFAMGEYYIGWDTSIMHTIFKNKGSKEDPDNYRGIALAPILSKVYSKLLYERLKPW